MQVGPAAHGCRAFVIPGPAGVRGGIDAPGSTEERRM